MGALPTLTGRQNFVIFGTNVLQRSLTTLDFEAREYVFSASR
jgi:hypothetical protein